MPIDVEDFTILTKDAEGEMKSVHNRMPVIIPVEKESIWLDQRVRNITKLKRIFDFFDYDFIID
ncbi:MAG TPA: SOS response-associated peptidase family protein [Tissierellales bacterium]|nr:SOS response-associated peptidase family protein [Tissierellales bacterium]